MRRPALFLFSLLILGLAAAVAAGPLKAEDFVTVDSIDGLRAYANRDGVKVRLKPGTYVLDRATSSHFLEFSGRDAHFDLHGVTLRIDTRLFSQFGARGGPEFLYCVIGLAGDGIVFEGLTTENFGDRPGIQSKNKIFNITGRNVILRDVDITTSGSSPWGYGSLYGISGGDVRKMNGIRIGFPSRNVQVLNCRVHMRAMGHGIFIQGAEDTVIRDCEVDGLLKPTDRLLAETSGYAFDRNFVARGRHYIEGVTVGPDGRILPGEMIALSEDGIRLYVSGGPGGHPTGATTIENCRVRRMRRGICTGLNQAADRVINCEVEDCVAAGFNAGNGDTLMQCRANARYAEALCLPYVRAHGARVELEITDSRDGLANDLLAVINGRDHVVNLTTRNRDFVPPQFTIEFATRRGYAFYVEEKLTATAITLTNGTPAKVVRNPGAQKVDLR